MSTAFEYVPVEAITSIGKTCNAIAKVHQIYAKKKLCVLVFPQDGTKPRYHITHHTDPEKLEEELGLDPTQMLQLGTYVQSDHSEFRPYEHVLHGWTLDSSSDYVCDSNYPKQFHHLHSVTRLAAWIVPRNTAVVKLNVYARGKYDAKALQVWGYTMMYDSTKNTKPKILANALAVFGPGYEYEWVANKLVVKNPDDAFLRPDNAWMAHDSGVRAYATQHALHHEFKMARFRAQRCKFDKCTLKPLTRNTVGSINVLLNDDMDMFCWIALNNHFSKGFLEANAFKKDLLVMREHPILGRVPRHVKNMHALDRLDPPPFRPEPLCLGLHMELRPDQQAVLASMIHREKTQPLEDCLFVKIAESDTTELMYSAPMSNGFSVFGTRDKNATNKMYGGLVVAELGWGKTVLALALIQSQKRKNTPAPTLVVAPNKLIITQWMLMCNTMTTLRSRVCVDKSDVQDTNFYHYDVIFTTYPKTTNREDKVWYFPWDRVIFDEIHELKKNQSIYHPYLVPKARKRWGLTATPSTAADPNLLKPLACILNLSDRSNGFNYIYEPHLLAKLTIKAASDTTQTWTLEEHTVHVTLPPENMQLYRNLLAEMESVGWNPQSKLAGVRIHKVIAGAPTYFVPGGANLCAMPSRIFDGECPICTEQAEEGTVLHCGHVFCGRCIDAWLDTKKECPVCRQRVTNSGTPLEAAKEHLENGEDTTVDIDGWLDVRATKTVELIRQASGKVVVFSRYKENLQLVQSKLGASCVDMSSTQATDLIAERLDIFATNPRCKAILLYVSQSAGMNLQAASNVVFMEKPLNDIDYTQGVGRIARRGQTASVITATVILDKDLD